jgi:hypothetical protein
MGPGSSPTRRPPPRRTEERSDHEFGRLETPAARIRPGRSAASSPYVDCAFLDWPADPHQTPSGGSPALTPDRSKTPAAGYARKGLTHMGPLQKRHSRQPRSPWMRINAVAPSTSSATCRAISVGEATLPGKQLSIPRLYGGVRRMARQIGEFHNNARKPGAGKARPCSPFRQLREQYVKHLLWCSVVSMLVLSDACHGSS